MRLHVEAASRVTNIYDISTKPTPMCSPLPPPWGEANCVFLGPRFLELAYLAMLFIIIINIARTVTEKVTEKLNLTCLMVERIWQTRWSWFCGNICDARPISLLKGTTLTKFICIYLTYNGGMCILTSIKISGETGCLELDNFPTPNDLHSDGSWDKSKSPYLLRNDIIPNSATVGAPGTNWPVDSWCLDPDGC